MASDDLWLLVKSGRSERLDWLSENAPLDTMAAILTAMANSQGGTLVLGLIGPTATLLGVRDASSAIDRVIQAALSIEPALIIPMPRPATLKEKQVVVVHIPPGMPHVYALDGRYLIRQGIENTALKPRELRRLIIERGELSFETDIAHGTSLDDIDWDKAKAYLTTLGGINEAEVEMALFRRGCLTQQEGRLRPTNAGILLFGKDPQRHIRGAEITAARFPGDTMSDSFKREDIGGTIPDQIRRAEAFLRDHLRKDVSIGRTMARDESFEYPLEAARELVVNAAAHRDYSIAGDGIRLFIFRSRMEVTSPGGLPGPVTIDNIKDERFSRNPVIVQVLSDMGFIERLGYGVDRVIDLMQEKKLRAPQFEETAGGFRVSLYNDPVEEKPVEPPKPDPFKLDGQYKGKPLNTRQEVALLYVLRDGNSRITNSDLQTLCPDVHPETIRRDLADLVAKDILRKLGEKRGSYYVLNDAT
ncbi:MAG: putative DNA binding domain-containing protein [Anaerolineae bacterium]|nr:putative DNA binding domain-containing protein [Anaerolineae bacterium]